VVYFRVFLGWWSWLGSLGEGNFQGGEDKDKAFGDIDEVLVGGGRGVGVLWGGEADGRGEFEGEEFVVVHGVGALKWVY